MIIENFIAATKSNFKKTVMKDSLGMSLNFGQIFTASVLLSKQIRNFRGENIALLFPSSAGGALAYIATALTGKTPVCLNFLASKEDQDYILKFCDVGTVFTSKAFIERAGIPHDSRMVFIEDVRKRFSGVQKLKTYLSCKIRSEYSLIQEFKGYDDPGKTAAILFTSGSESSPKGVPVTYYNIYSSLENFSKVFKTVQEDVILGILPFFHVFGYIVCLWFPLIKNIGVVFHPNPTEYEKLGRIVHDHKVTILIGTNTLYRGFTKKWKKEQVQSVRLAFAGAEKLQEQVREKFYRKFGIRILEGYGLTESCSCVSVNYPDDFVNGSVGRIFPNIECRIVNPETYKVVSQGEEGLILIKGPNIIGSYYRSPDLNKQSFYGDFYITGDIGKIENGFLFITDRLKRFAKIGGEMVPLSPVEDKLSVILDDHSDHEKRNCAVVSIPHDQKGEQIVAFVVQKNPDKLFLNARLDTHHITKLSQPDYYISVEAIPILPSGKIDYRKLKHMALEQLAQDKKK
ncbi:MAG: AMP-binding protein [Candidatus Loosdrechtia sp.]|uniref:AMP-binding protein n=1 Tax=Candidatus Loosdrechtia sp. TaxID=3101272 RepID=UPI003A756B37|nr:MAG: AMP-binding protein [Candidatus Jettenia sp. AMX2]